MSTDFQSGSFLGMALVCYPLDQLGVREGAHEEFQAHVRALAADVRHDDYLPAVIDRHVSADLLGLVVDPSAEIAGLLFRY